MAYNTRRGGGSGGYMTASSASVGQRRQGPNHQQQMGNNFVAGGQLTQPNKPLVQMPGQQQGVRQQQQQQQKPQQQQQQMQRQQQMAAQQQQNLRQQAQQFLNQQQQSAPPQQHNEQAQQPKIVFKPEEKPTPAAPPAPQTLMDTTNGGELEGDSNSVEGGDRKLRKHNNKPFWMRKDGKINKKERLRRRNQRLRKILQPKNALMVLNELIGSTPYTLSESPDMYEGTVFKCTVQVDGMDHAGVGKSKPAAKTAAAEAALKHMVLSKLKNSPAFDPTSVSFTSGLVSSQEDNDGDVKMETDSEDILGGISWSHVACYALHKLLSSWDEGTNLAEKLVQVAAGGGPVAVSDAAKTFEKKPAKKLPDTASTMNPIMLLNQMHPSAVYEEMSKTGNPPNVQFTIKCTVGGEAFLGSGSSKKTARKMCAFAACRKILGIQYAPEFLEEHGFNEHAVSTAPAAPVQVA